MNKTYKLLLILIGLALLSGPVAGQDQDTAKIAADRIENYKEQVKRLLSFFEFSLNTLGDPETPTREKEIIINDSFLKAFRDEEVMIEDDLDENREMVTHKSVQAYLKDVDFFFKEVEFDIKTQEILPQFNDRGELYFKVIATRNLKGVTVEGDSVLNDRLRYFELNLDESDEILKIVSIYTTRLNEREELVNWWGNLPMAWKRILGDDTYIVDSISLSQVESLEDSVFVVMRDTLITIEIDTFLVFGVDSLRIKETDTLSKKVYDSIPINTGLVFNILQKIVDTRSLDLSGNLNINSLKPLRKLTSLESLDISNTLVDNLFPIRNLIRLELLAASGTAITDIEPLVYSTRLRNLDISHTRVRSVSAVSNMRDLESLDISNTPVDSLYPVSSLSKMRDLRFENSEIRDLTALSGLSELELLNCSGTMVTSLRPVEFLVRIERLYIERTGIKDLSPLENIDNLRILYADGSEINSLKGLEDLPALRYIYCDGAPIKAAEAQRFMLANKDVLVVYESETLSKWWQDLEPGWKKVFRSYISLDTVPTKEQLHEITLLKSIDISGNDEIGDITPLSKLSTLVGLSMNDTEISSLKPLQDLIDLETISANNTPVRELSPLSDLLNLRQLSLKNTLVTSLEELEGLTNLRRVNIENTGVENLHPLATNQSLQKVFCDGTSVVQENVTGLRTILPGCLVIYQTPELKAWWGSLNNTWKNVFIDKAGVEHNPGREQLQQIADLETVSINNMTEIDYLDPLKKLIYLSELSFSGCQVADISTLTENKDLTKLDLSNNPIVDITPLSSLEDLTELNLSNTPVDELDPITGLIRLQYLKFSGTEVKKLDPLSGLRLLKVIECYNTRVRKLDPILELPNLELLKCYNTKISERRIEEFKSLNPDCEVIYY